MSFDQGMIKLIDEMIHRLIPPQPIMATITDPGQFYWAQAVLDGSAVAMPVRNFLSTNYREGDRVGLIKFGTQWVIVGGYMPPDEGYIDGVTAVTNSAAIGAETVVSVSNTITWKPGHVLAIHLSGTLTAATGTSYIQLRKGNTTGGTQLWNWGGTLPGTAIAVPGGRALVANATTATITSEICATILTSAGTVIWNGAPSEPPRGFSVWNVGKITDTYHGMTTTAPMKFIT